MFLRNASKGSSFERVSNAFGASIDVKRTTSSTATGQPPDPKTMPLAPVDNKGTQFYYEDSGPITSAGEYETLVLFHGIYFNGAIFQRLVPYAREKNIRIVRPNLRDSRGSTPFSQPELNILRSGDKDAQKEFLIQRTTEVANFLRWFIEKEKIPKISESQGRRVGGISIANWSASGCLATSLLGFGASLPSSTREFLGDYLRSVILYDPPFAVLGLTPLTIEECYLPFLDPTLSNEEKVNRFPEWVTSYYTHSSSTLSSFCIQNYDELPTREEFLEGVASTPDSEPAPSLLRTSQEILKQVSDPEGVFRSHNPMLFINREIRAEAFEKALFDDETTSKIFPNVEVSVVVCRQSTGVCMYSAWEIHGRIVKHRREKGGPTARPLSMRFWAKMNHAPHWDQPDQTMNLLADIM